LCSAPDAFLCGVSPDAARDTEVTSEAEMAVGDDDHRELFEEVSWHPTRRAPSCGPHYGPHPAAPTQQTPPLDTTSLILPAGSHPWDPP